MFLAGGIASSWKWKWLGEIRELGWSQFLKGPTNKALTLCVHGRRAIGGSTLQQCGGMVGLGERQRDQEAVAWVQVGDNVVLDRDGGHGAEGRRGKSEWAMWKCEEVRLGLQFPVWATSYKIGKAGEECKYNRGGVF